MYRNGYETSFSKESFRVFKADSIFASGKVALCLLYSVTARSLNFYGQKVALLAELGLLIQFLAHFHNDSLIIMIKNDALREIDTNVNESFSFCS